MNGRVALAIVAVLLVALFAGAPSRTRVLDAQASRFGPVIRGAYHVHTRRSDGTGTVESIAAAARRAGLNFVIFTDHGDGTGFDAPAYHSGVLCIDAVEITTEAGHVAALGMTRAPYPLAGAPADVVEDIARLGGAAVVAHSTSAKADLKWTEWQAPFDGIEWLNADSEWRDERAALVTALFTYPFRAPQTLAAMLDRPDEAIRRWDEAAEARPVIGLPAADAHARLGLDEEGQRRVATFALPVPGYEQIFKAFSIGVPRVTLSGDSAADARLVLDAIRAGRFYSSIDALAAPAAVSFTAASGTLRVQSGGTLAAGVPVTFRVDTNASDARIVLLRGGTRIAEVRGATLEHQADGRAGVYRAEVHLDDAPGTPPVPWIVTNPIYVRAPSATPGRGEPTPAAVTPLYRGGPATGWTIERSPQSRGAIDVTRDEVGRTHLTLRYALGGAISANPYVAFVVPAAGVTGHDRLIVTARSLAPMRVSVQARVLGAGDGERWHRSVYLDPTPRTVTIRLDEMTPRGPTSTPRPRAADVQAILFVVDTANTRPGPGGQFQISELSFAR